MKLAARAQRIVPSPTLNMTATAKALAAQGVDVVDFASGEPDFDTPEQVKAAAEAAMRAGFTKYTAASGIDELKSAIVKKFETDQGLKYEKSQILVSCGAKHSLYNLAQALFEAGDEILIPSPFWVSYQDQVLINDATPVIMQTRESDGFAVTRSLLEAHLTPRTKAINVNSPCNPTGSSYDRRTLEQIADVAIRQDMIIISDEIYEKILYDGTQHMSIAALRPDVAARTVVINGVSKAYAMTGWRIGYAAGPKELMTAMANIQSQSTSNPSSISQKAAVAALEIGTAFTEQMVTEFDRRNQRWEVKHFAPLVMDVVREELVRLGRVLPQNYDEKFEQATFNLDEPACRFMLRKDGVARVEATLVLKADPLGHSWQVVYLKWDDDVLIDRANPLAQQDG